MGQLCTPGQKRTYRPHKQDHPYVTAIANPKYLDWKIHMRIHLHGKERDEAILATNMIHLNMPCVVIKDCLYISDMMGVSDIHKLKQLNITHVLNVAGTTAERIPPEIYKEAGIDYKVIEALDDVSYPMLERHWEDAFHFIHDAIAQNKDHRVVVHCVAGMNRSGILVAGYYMVTQQENVLETIRHCRTCRGNLLLSTNPKFQQEIVALARYEGLLGPAPGEPDCIVKVPL